MSITGILCTCLTACSYFVCENSIYYRVTWLVSVLSILLSWTAPVVVLCRPIYVSHLLGGLDLKGRPHPNLYPQDR